MEAIGGSNICWKLDERVKNNAWAIDKLDMHPNSLGHREISNLFMEWYDNEL